MSLDSTLADPNDLWLQPRHLPLVNDFELKPEGACLDDICVPIRQDEDSAIYVTRQEEGWLNLTELARRLQQPYVVDIDHKVWSFGQIPATRQGFLNQQLAPDFSLTDAAGKPVRLADYQRRKILLLTWASW